MAGTGIFDNDPKYQQLKRLREDEAYTGPVDENGNTVTSGRAAEILQALRDRT